MPPDSKTSASNFVVGVVNDFIWGFAAGAGFIAVIALVKLIWKVSYFN